MKTKQDNMAKRWAAFLLAAVMGLSSILIPVQTAAGDMQWEEHAQTLAAFGVRYHFTEFMRDHANTPRPNAEYVIEATDYTLVGGMTVRHYDNFEGMPGLSVWTDEEGLIEWQVYVSQPGLYNMSVTYFPVQGRNSDIQRAIFINGEQPFFEANPVEFRRIWVNAREYFQRDNQGNDLRPPQVERPKWIESIVQDAMGTYNEPLAFYFEAGWNTIGFFSQREPMLIRSIRIHQQPIVLPYAQVRQGHAGLPRPSVAQVAPIRIEGQYAVRKSSPMLAPQSDMGGPGVYPYSPRYIRINHIGGGSWSEPGSWIEWEFEVPQDGLYKIAMNVRQNFNRGALSYRRISINGEVPFYEMNAVPFDFRANWRVDTLGGVNDPYLFWLPAGVHTLRMEAVLGDYAPHVREIEDIIMNLNEMYRQIVMITGQTPDIFRDYEINRRLPHLRDAIIYDQRRLERIFNDLDQMTTGRGERDAVIRTLARLLNIIAEDVENIPRRLREFRENTGALGTWLMLVRSQELAVDAIYILPYDAPTPDNGHRWWRQIWHEILTLIFSFIIDYNVIGNLVDDPNMRQVEVWIGTGRDQANVINSMISERFTPETGIGVTLRLVDITMILPATVAGIGPDITLSIFNSLPMDYGMRGAVRDLSTFPDFHEVAARFPEAAMVPYTFDGRVFALPETLTFPMLFYRRDVLHEIGLEPPDTWDDVRAAIATLAMHHMEFGIPLGASAASPLDFPHQSFGIFLFQNGGEFYNADGSLSALDSPVAMEAFRDFTRFFTDYNLPRVYDFANRFRFGDMPLAIADYTVYNMLQVFAPEIRGLWGFRPVPGTIQPDGSINRTVPTGGTAVVMMEQVNDADAAWEFMKWWTSAEIQTQFGREMESLMGSAARHPTANLEAFGMMPWPVQDYRMMRAQFNYIRGIPEVPGGYFTPRQVRNAFYVSVEVRNIGPREALQDNVRLINDELRAKRREFGLE
ncbi:MAG: extracellular solute-binding protein [Defluviitaleaceae bacterium]|nr:extracellular solute-binding protein [Defluviitaleaceae bacterium]MCL2273767.1 extracellular solute-binding protein [Defluviitaleaceae bacterium]